NGAKPLRVRFAVERAVDFLAEAERFVFRGYFEKSATRNVHLVECLYGGKPRDATLVGMAHQGQIAVSGLRHFPSGSELFSNGDHGQRRARGKAALVAFVAAGTNPCLR